MARTLLIVAILLTLTGCPQQREEPTLEQQLAARTAELEEAKSSKSFWKTTALVLLSAVVIALAIGALLGSKAKEDADGK